jgi:hypothetical protein
MKHPDVSEAAVIGIPDPDSGEAVKTFAVLKEGARVTEQELMAFCRNRIAVYKVPCGGIRRFSAQESRGKDSQTRTSGAGAKGHGTQHYGVSL